MKIIVFGNIGSGKSTVSNQIEKLFSFDIVAIDDFRRKFGDGTELGELLARKNFFSAIQPDKNQVIECVGIGKVADELFLLLHNFSEPIVCVILLVPKEICQQRLEMRTWDIPFPKPIENVSVFMEKAEKKMSNKEIERQWTEHKNVTFLKCKNILPTDIQMIVSDLQKEIEMQKFS